MKTTLGILALAAGLTANAAGAQTYTAVEIDVNTTPNGINDSGLVAGTTLVTDHWNIASYLNPLARPAVPYRVYPLSRDSVGHTQNTVIHAVNQGGMGVGGVGGDLTLRYAINDHYGYSPANGLLRVPEAWWRRSSTDTQAAWFANDGRATLLGTLPGTTSSLAVAVNDAGWAVGRAWVSDPISTTLDPTPRPFLWVPHSYDLTHGDMVELSCPPGTLNGEATSINNGGLIGGHCDGAPYLWWSGAGYDITSWLPEEVQVFGRVRNRAALSRERVFGCSVSAIADSYAFAINCAVSQKDNINLPIDLPPRGKYPVPEALARPTDILAFVSTPSQPVLAQIPPPSPFSMGGNVYYGGVSAYSINDRGCAVGGVAPFFAGQDYYPAVHDVRHAFKYCPDEALTILDEHVVSGGERLLGDYARAINNHDQILVQGAVLEWAGGWNHASAAYLLTPAR